MIIKKILNNNVIISENEEFEEIVVMGRGIAFQKKIGQSISENGIDKVFVTSSSKTTDTLEQLIQQVDSDVLEVSKEIMMFAEKESGIEYSEKAYVTLADHLNYAVERNTEGIFIPNPLLFEIKKFYPNEYKISLASLDIIRARLNITFSEDEAGFIALHLANSVEYSQNMHVTMESTEIVRDILTIISRFFGVMFDETSLNYNRMVTHIQYFVQRILNNEVYEDHDIFLYELVQSKYPEAFRCSLRIKEYLNKTKHVNIQDSEMIYLVIHINRVISDRNRIERQ